MQLFGRHSVQAFTTVFSTLLHKTLAHNYHNAFLHHFGVHVSWWTKSTVWLYDGTYQFGNGRHLALLIVSVDFLLVITIPYTLLIFFVQKVPAAPNSEWDSCPTSRSTHTPSHLERPQKTNQPILSPFSKRLTTLSKKSACLLSIAPTLNGKRSSNIPA